MFRKNCVQHGLKSTRYRGAKLWIAPLFELRGAQSKSLYKSQLKIYGGAFSLIGLSNERAPSLSNSLHAICLFNYSICICIIALSLFVFNVSICVLVVCSGIILIRAELNARRKCKMVSFENAKQKLRPGILDMGL